MSANAYIIVKFGLIYNKHSDQISLCKPQANSSFFTSSVIHGVFVCFLQLFIAVKPVKNTLPEAQVLTNPPSDYKIYMKIYKGYFALIRKEET